MPRTHEPSATHANPLEFTVEHFRTRSGTLLWTKITHMPSGEVLVDHDTYEEHGADRLLSLAWNEERRDPYSDRLPQDDSFIRAALRDMGCDLSDETPEPAPGAPDPTDILWRGVRLTMTVGDGDDWNANAGIMFDDHCNDSGAQDAILRVAAGASDSETLGGGASPTFTIMRAAAEPDDAPPAEMDAATALQIAIDICRVVGSRHGPALTDALQALLEQQTNPAA